MIPLYRLNHLLISKNEYKTKSPEIKGLSVSEIEPDAKTVRHWVEQVGGSYGWADRDQYTLEAIEDLIKTPDTRLFILAKDGLPIGYCLTHAEKPEALTTHFTKAGYNIGADEKITRIEGFGLKASETKNDYGDFYLQQMFKIMFEHGDSDHVYLTSRSTNHPRVVPFYLGNGMHLIDVEKKEEDRPLHLIQSERGLEFPRAFAS